MSQVNPSQGSFLLTTSASFVLENDDWTAAAWINPSVHPTQSVALLRQAASNCIAEVLWQWCGDHAFFIIFLYAWHNDFDDQSNVFWLLKSFRYSNAGFSSFRSWTQDDKVGLHLSTGSSIICKTMSVCYHGERIRNRNPVKAVTLRKLRQFPMWDDFQPTA